MKRFFFTRTYDQNHQASRVVFFYCPGSKKLFKYFNKKLCKYFYVIVFVKIWSSNISLSLQIHIKGDSYLNLIKHSFFVFTKSTMRTIQSSSHKVCGTQCLFVHFPCLFKASALWADAFYKSICPSVCLYICLSVCSLLRYRLNVFLPPLPEVGCPNIFPHFWRGFYNFHSLENVLPFPDLALDF